MNLKDDLRIIDKEKLDKEKRKNKIWKKQLLIKIKKQNELLKEDPRIKKLEEDNKQL